MSGSVLTYDPSSVIISVAGWIVPGVVSLSLNWKSQVFTVRKGIRGVHTRVYNQDRQATLVVELLPTSIANDVFTSIVLQDAANHAGLLDPVMLKDTSGTSRFTTSQAYINTFPDLTFNSDGLVTRKWEIEILSFVTASGNIGGNASNGVDINDILSGALSSAKGLAEDGLAAVSSYF
ncbi:hypothetical protein QGX11_gp015 [Pseudomonas phage PPSC2]|uniref:Tail tube protein n=1 Tax=Pseudomonas phage PPSC2 TaxID=2041350 RepID=A0A2R2YAJ0_9CAUD|nr:hypothetical protein QGX11_gp015 [Pseudomonas phage PPSC2]ATN92778.1 hypothetical protein PPSC2_15 [Pseudomonas phage PPSC2]